MSNELETIKSIIDYQNLSAFFILLKQSTSLKDFNKIIALVYI